MLVEFASNDVFDTGAFKSQERLSFERLLRKLLDFPQRSVRPQAGLPVQTSLPDPRLSYLLYVRMMQAGDSVAQPLHMV